MSTDPVYHLGTDWERMDEGAAPEKLGAQLDDCSINLFGNL